MNASWLRRPKALFFRLRPAWTALAGLAALLAEAPAGAQDSTPCITPPLEVAIENIGVSAGDGGGAYAVLHLVDPNPPDIVTGYNIYRSASPSAPAHTWSIRGWNVRDDDDLMRGIQWTDTSDDPPASRVFYYLAAPYNGPCSLEGPWRTHMAGDADGDRLLDVEDACPRTPEGETPLKDGCAATDVLLRPAVLVTSVDKGIAEFLARNNGTSLPGTVPDSLTSARAALGSVFDDLWGAMPCDAETAYGAALDHLNDAVRGLQDYIAQLPAPGGAPGEAAETAGGVEGPYDWGSPESLYWKGQLFSLTLVVDEAIEAMDAASMVCAAQGPQVSLAGRVRSIADDERLLVLETGDRIVLARDAALPSRERLAQDTEVTVQGWQYGSLILGTAFDPSPSVLPILPGLIYDYCLQIRIAPIQPYPYPGGDWIRHPFDGYRGESGALDLEAGAGLIAENNGCPGILYGAGPSGEDKRIDYFYDITLSYQPQQGSPVSNTVLAVSLDADSFPVSFPDMDETTNGSLVATKWKRSCIEDPVGIPILDPATGNPMGYKPHWNCTPDEVVDVITETVVLRAAHYYASALYSSQVFDIEDDAGQDWRQTTVQSVNVNPFLVPTPVTFSAIGDAIVNGTPVHDQAIGLNQPFAVYGPSGHSHSGYGTNHRSFLDWPHITGTRNGEPFRYSTGVSLIVTDRVASCATPPSTFYRLPFPQGFPMSVFQGNGGSFSHDGWGFFSLDVGGDQGDPIRAARGGRVVKVRSDMNLNCMTQNCPNGGFPLLDEFGNHVAIQHQDGTVMWYLHMVFGSPAVFQNQIVKRGDYLGQVGNTGNSTGPHLHIHVTNEDPATWENATIKAHYEAADLSGTYTCLVPQEDGGYFSTNSP
jgi:murein DD-endopeptidase MepM/ murein hydrolase activator NlpD